jgi:hypothetical protein
MNTAHMKPILKEHNVDVEITHDRWTVRIVVKSRVRNEPDQVLVASWDRAIGDGEQWIGSEAEYDEAVEKI